MPSKNKIHFFQLSIVFGAIAICVLAFNWSDNTWISSDGMMNTSMGNMMSSMHLQNVSLQDIISQQEQTDTSAGSGGGSASHHDKINDLLNAVHIITITTMIIAVPLIVAGTVFLLIVWLR